MLQEQQRLEKIANAAKVELMNAPGGGIRLGKSHGCTQYYYKEGATHNSEYISKKEMALVKQLAQKDYHEKILRYAEKTALQIKKILKGYEDDKIEKIYLSLHSERQKLITPIEPTYEQQLNTWMATPFVGKGFSEGTPVIMTNSGIRVRSKSEKIMADYFDSIGLSYKYECPLHLNTFGIVYPDFTFLSKKNGENIYWEHEGMLDHPEYARNAVQKIELYEKNGIFPGEGLILTFETSMYALNTELLKKITQKYLL